MYSIVQRFLYAPYIVLPLGTAYVRSCGFVVLVAVLSVLTAVLCRAAASSDPSSARDSGFGTAETGSLVLTEASPSGSGLTLTAPGLEVADVPELRQPVLRFSAAHAPQDERYAPAAEEAAWTDACAWARSGLFTVASQKSSRSSRSKHPKLTLEPRPSRPLATAGSCGLTCSQ